MCTIRFPSFAQLHYSIFSDALSEEAKSMLGNKKKKAGDGANESNAISVILDFKRYVFDKKMSQ